MNDKLYEQLLNLYNCDKEKKIIKNTKNENDKNNYSKKKYHAQIFDNHSEINIKQINGKIYIKEDNENTLKINISSPFFNDYFKDKNIKNCQVFNNNNNSIDIIFNL